MQKTIIFQILMVFFTTAARVVADDETDFRDTAGANSNFPRGISMTGEFVTKPGKEIIAETRDFEKFFTEENTKITGVKSPGDTLGVVTNGKNNFYVVNRKESNLYTWSSDILQEGCSSGFEVTPNFIQWKVTGLECGFVLFKRQGCRGVIDFDTNGFNVVSDGYMENLEFKSVYFACR